MLSNLGYAIGRAMIAAILIFSGWAKVVDVSGIAATLARAGFPQPRLVGYAAGAVELAGGVLLAIGFRTRWAALALLLFTAAATYISDAFWTMEGAQYATQRIHALKNLAIMGGLLAVATAGSGRLSIDRGR